MVTDLKSFRMMFTRLLKMQQNTCAEVSEMQCFVTILVRNDDTFEAIFGNKNRLCATFLPRNKRQMHFFCVETLLTRVKSGVSNCTKFACYVACKNTIRI